MRHGPFCTAWRGSFAARPWILEPITASNHRASKAATRRFAVGLAICLTGLLVLLTFDALARAYFRDFSGLSQQTTEVAMSGVPWLLGFPALCVIREWIRGALVARGLSSHTVKGVAVGFVMMLFAFTVGYGALELAPIEAAAMSVLAGAALESVALWLWSLQPEPVLVPAPVPQTAQEPNADPLAQLA